MPRLDDSTTAVPDEEEGWGESFEDWRRTAYSTWDNFSNFALRDNVLEVAVGLM
jgi:hypothetical protein